MSEPTRAEQLTAQGWTKRFTASEPRLSEAVRTYRELGFEVHLEPVASEDLPAAACAECYLVRSRRVFVVYTRPKG